MRIIDQIDHHQIRKPERPSPAKAPEKETDSESSVEGSDKRPTIKNTSHRKPLTPDEIMAKVNENKAKLAKLNTKVDVKSPPSAKKGEEVAKAKEAAESEEAEETETADGEHILESDVGKNDPTDPVTQEKLRDVLKSGSFNFNEKERKALASILDV